jgi:hypothetical protein
MLGRPGSHNGHPGQPFLGGILLDSNSQALVGPYQVLVTVLPGSYRPIGVDILGESQCYADLSAIEQPAGRIAALDISGVFTQQCEHFGGIQEGGCYNAFAGKVP